jgi:hypothetical protein
MQNIPKTEANTMQNQSSDSPLLVGVSRAAEILNKTEMATRQLITRGRIRSVRTGTGQNSVQAVLEDVLTYHAKKLGLKSWIGNEDNWKGRAFYTVNRAADALGLTSLYIRDKVRAGLIEGYVTPDGQLMVAEDSINKDLRTIDIDPSDTL